MTPLTISLSRLIQIRDTLDAAKQKANDLSDTEHWHNLLKAHSYVAATVEVASREIQIEVTQ